MPRGDGATDAFEQVEAEREERRRRVARMGADCWMTNDGDILIIEDEMTPSHARNAAAMVRRRLEANGQTEAVLGETQRKRLANLDKRGRMAEEGG